MDEVTDNPEQSRYEVHVDGRLAGFLEYRREGDVVRLPHTEICPDYAGRGLAGRLVSHALDEFAAAGDTVRPECSFVAGWLERHPDHPVARA
nr:GNAT family N-acetyltransferase [Acidipropionibacterium timonense]